MAGQLLILEALEPAQPKPQTARRFTVWCGSSISPAHQTMQDLARTTYALLPTSDWDQIELLLKAGEGGSWQSSFDAHPLAISGAVKLRELVDEGNRFGLRISPYVVARGRSAWVPFEQGMIRQCVQVAGRCVINTEPGAAYWNGSADPANIRRYLSGIGVDPSALEVCLIPRATQVAELGGVSCLQAWTDPTLVGGASWECYGITAGISGTTSLLVNEAIPRLDGWGVPADPSFRIPVVQRDERSRWANTPWCAAGMAVWFLDGN